MENIIKSFKFIPKMGLALSFPLLLLSALFLFFGRNVANLRISHLEAFLPDFYAHISNFSITFILYITAGYMGLLMGLNLKHLAIIGMLIAAVSYVIELFVPILNTPDSMDALYGLSGVCFGFIFLVLSKRFGLQPNTL